MIKELREHGVAAFKPDLEFLCIPNGMCFNWNDPRRPKVLNYSLREKGEVLDDWTTE